METNYQEEIKPQTPPPPPGFVLESELTQSPPGDFVPEETLIERADRAAHEALMGPIEGVANIGTGAAGWMGGQAFGYGKMLYDYWRTNGRGGSWQDFEKDFHNASKAISSVGGLYQPKTQLGTELARMAGKPFEAADTYWFNIVDKLSDDPEVNAALKTVGGTAIGLILGKVVHSAGKGVVKGVKRSVKGIPAHEIIVTPPEASPAVKEVAQAIRQIKPLQAEQQVMRRQQYAQRFAESRAAADKFSGEEWARQAKKPMGGEMEKVEFEYSSIRQKVTPENRAELYNMLRDTPLLDQGEKLSVIDMLDTLFYKEGVKQLPQPKQLLLASRVYGKDFVSAVRKNWDTWTKVKHNIIDVVNIPRSLKASYDMSAPFRQGLYLMWRKEFWKNLKPMFKMLQGRETYHAMMKEIAQRDTYQYMKEGKLELTDLSRSGGPAFLAMREEPFYSQLAEQIPVAGKGVEISGRLYTGFLNKVRADVFDSFFKDAQKLGLKPEASRKLTRDIAKVINTLSGRGSLKAKHQEMASFLNIVIWSPRLIKSRLDMMNPVFYARLHPYARKQALKSLGSVIGMGATALSLAKLAGLQVGDEPTSANFGKIGFGNTWLDVWGGQQQYIVPLFRLALNETTSATTGKTQKLGERYGSPTRWDIALRSAEYKTSPSAGFVIKLMKGRDYKGKPVKVTDEMLEMIYPLVAKDIYDIWQDDPSHLPLGIPAMFGMGVQTYEPKKGIVR